jgi:hypothetical protein
MQRTHHIVVSSEKVGVMGASHPPYLTRRPVNPKRRRTLSTGSYHFKVGQFDCTLVLTVYPRQCRICSETGTAVAGRPA